MTRLFLRGDPRGAACEVVILGGASHDYISGSGEHLQAAIVDTALRRGALSLAQNESGIFKDAAVV